MLPQSLTSLWPASAWDNQWWRWPDLLRQSVLRRVEKFQVIFNIFSRVSSGPGCECPYCLFAILFSWFKWITLMAALNELILSQFEVSASHSLSFYCGTKLELLCGGHLDIFHFRGSFLFDNSCSWLILSYFRIIPNHASWILRFLPFHCGHVTFKGGFWLVEIFLLQIWHIWAILRPFYPWSFFDSGIISKKNSPKTHFWGPFHKFFSRILNNSLKKWDFIKKII